MIIKRGLGTYPHELGIMVQYTLMFHGIKVLLRDYVLIFHYKILLKSKKHDALFFCYHIVI